MKRSWLLLLLCAALLAPVSAGAQELVVVVRHAERADQSTDPSLSPDGAARAQRLATQLKDAGITTIYTTDLKRTMETAAPLATAAGIKATALPAADRDGLLARLRAAGAHDRILVVGHSNTVPEVLKALGVTTPVTLADTDYDNLFFVSPRAGTTPLFIRLRY